MRPVTLKASFDRPLGGDNDVGRARATTTSPPSSPCARDSKRDGVEVERASALRAALVGAARRPRAAHPARAAERVEDVLRYLALLLQDPSIDDVASALWEASNDDDGTGDGRDRGHGSTTS